MDEVTSGVTYKATAGTITSLTVTPSNAKVGQVTNYVIVIVPSNSLGLNGWV